MSCGSICWAAAEKLLVFTKRTRTRLKVCYRTCRGVRGKLQKPPPAYQGTSRPAVRPANPAASKYVCPSTVWLRNKVLRPFAAGSEDSMRRITSGSDSSAWRPRLSVSTRPVNLPFGVSIGHQHHLQQIGDGHADIGVARRPPSSSTLGASSFPTTPRSDPLRTRIP